MLDCEESFWTITDARELLEALEPWLRERGWVTSLCGSVLLYGSGRDLDLIAVPTTSGCDGQALLAELPDMFGWRVLSPNDRQAGFLSELYRDRQGRLVDFTALTARRAG